MNKNGFTIVELLAVIAISIIILLIGIPTYIGTNKAIRKKMYCQKRDLIVNAAKNYANDNLNNYTNECYEEISVSDLADMGYVKNETKNLVNPYTNETMADEKVDIYINDKRPIVLYNESNDELKVACETEEQLNQLASIIPNNKCQNDSQDVTSSPNNSKGLYDIVLLDNTNAKTVSEAQSQIENRGIPDFSVVSPRIINYEVDTSDSGLFATKDDEGTSYYFRGKVDNNYVKFGEKNYRIIRTNGDKTVRLILNESISAPHYIDISVNYNPTYVGYMYKEGGNKSSDDIHVNEVDSTVKNIADSWYKTNIDDLGLTKYVANGIFCNDRSISSGTGYSLTTYYDTSKVTYYGAYERLFNNKTPSLLCENIQDQFTLKGSGKGNQKLNYAVGLITADELALAGVVRFKANSLMWLYNGTEYWTMTPYYFRGKAWVWYVYPYNSMDGNYTYTDSYSMATIRPVINLKADSAVSSGDGTLDNPYIIKLS